MGDALATWFEGLKSGPHMATVNKAKSHALAAGHAVRAVGEGAVVGALLATVDATVAGGLDQHVGMMPKPIPVDGTFAALALVGAVALGADQTASVDLANAGASAASIFAFRKTRDFIHERQGAPSVIKAALGSKAAAAKVAGEFGGHARMRQKHRTGTNVGAEFGADPVLDTINSWG